MEDKQTTIFTASCWFKFPGRNINCTKTFSTVQNSKWKRVTIFTARKVVASINIWVRTDKNYRDTLCNHSHRPHTQDWKSTQGVTKTHLDKTFQWTWILWRPPWGHPRRPKIEHKKSGSVQACVLSSSMFMWIFTKFCHEMAEPLGFIQKVPDENNEQ